MICLETLGYYTDAPDSQKYPAPFSWFYPSTGNFVGFVGNLDSRPLVRDCVASFRAHAAYGLILLREGDRKGAVEQMLEAAKLHGGHTYREAAGGWATALEYRLVFYLLMANDRVSLTTSNARPRVEAKSKRK